MIDPHNIIKYSRTEAELEELILFLVMVSNKNAEIEAIKLEWFLAERPVGASPLQYVHALYRTPVVGCNALMERLRHWRISPYGARYNAFWTLALRARKRDHSVLYPRLDLATCSREELVQIPFISMKTASLFLLDTRPGVEVAALDTHILAELRANGYFEAPRTSPQNPDVYARWERKWLDHCARLGKDPAAYDLEVWSRRSTAAKTRTKTAPVQMAGV